MGADYTFYVKSIETHARTFLPLNISAISSVCGEQLNVDMYFRFQGFSTYFIKVKACIKLHLNSLETKKVQIATKFHLNFHEFCPP